MFNAEKVLDKALKDLRDLCSRRKHDESELVRLNLVIRSLAYQVDDKTREEALSELKAARRKPAGLTEAISECLRATPQYLSANEVREWLEREGFDLSDYSQPLATISVTLRRLVEGKRVKAKREGRSVTYKWIGD